MTDALLESMGVTEAFVRAKVMVEIDDAVIKHLRNGSPYYFCCSTVIIIKIFGCIFLVELPSEIRSWTADDVGTGLRKSLVPQTVRQRITLRYDSSDNLNIVHSTDLKKNYDIFSTRCFYLQLYS